MYDQILATLNDLFYNLPKEKDKEKLRYISVLRDQVISSKKSAVEHRMQTNPHMTEEEIILGCYAEALDSQARNTIINTVKKGYIVDPRSGFTGTHGERQSMIGYFVLDNETKRELINIGVSVLEHGAPYGGRATTISFKSTNNLFGITKKWDQIDTIIKEHKTLDLHSPDTIMNSSDLMLEVMEKKNSDFRQRKISSPEPTVLEKRAGFYAESVDLPARAAAFSLTEKGYKITAIGFSGQKGENQILGGYFSINNNLKRRLKETGVKTKRTNNPNGTYTCLIFPTGKTNINALQTRWNQLASVLPQR